MTIPCQNPWYGVGAFGAGLGTEVLSVEKVLKSGAGVGVSIDLGVGLTENAKSP